MSPGVSRRAPSVGLGLLAASLALVEAEFSGETVELVDCAEVPTFEVVGNTTLEWDAEFPGEDEMWAIGDQYCFEALDEIGAPLSFNAFVVRPTSQTWAYGDRTITCLAEALEPTTGSLFD